MRHWIQIRSGKPRGEELMMTGTCIIKGEEGNPAFGSSINTSRTNYCKSSQLGYLHLQPDLTTWFCDFHCFFLSRSFFLCVSRAASSIGDSALVSTNHLKLQAHLTALFCSSLTYQLATSRHLQRPPLHKDNKSRLNLAAPDRLILLLKNS